MSSKYSPKSCYEIAYGGFINISNISGDATDQDKQDAKEALIYFNENVPGFREQAAEAYKDIMVEIKDGGSSKSMEDLRQFGNELCFEQEQQLSYNATDNGKSKCCHLL